MIHREACDVKSFVQFVEMDEKSTVIGVVSVLPLSPLEHINSI